MTQCVQFEPISGQILPFFGKPYNSVQSTDYILGCGAFSFNSQRFSLRQAYLLLELLCSALLAETVSKCYLVFGVARMEI